MSIVLEEDDVKHINEILRKYRLSIDSNAQIWEDEDGVASPDTAHCSDRVGFCRFQTLLVRILTVIFVVVTVSCYCSPKSGCSVN